MIDVLFEQRIVQNTGLGAEAIWQAVQECFDSSSRTRGLSFPMAFVVLPLVFHQRTAIALATKSQPGALYKALASDREITLGLQKRMQAMADRTFAAISIGFSTSLIRFDQNSGGQLLPCRKTPPVAHVTEEVITILKASKRVGQAMAEMTPAQVAVHLNIRF